MPYLHSKAISANDVNSNFKSLKRGKICSVAFKLWHQNKILAINKGLFSRLTAAVVLFHSGFQNRTVVSKKGTLKFINIFQREFHTI